MVHEYQQFVSDPILVYGPLVTLICSNFSFRSVRNFVIDLRRCVRKRMVSVDNNLQYNVRIPPARSQGTGIHWQVAQATSLMNIVVEMSTVPGTAHQGWLCFFNVRVANITH